MTLMVRDSDDTLTAVMGSIDPDLTYLILAECKEGCDVLILLLQFEWNIFQVVKIMSFYLKSRNKEIV